MVGGNIDMDLHISTRSSKGSLAKQVNTLGAIHNFGNVDNCLSKLVAGLPKAFGEDDRDIVVFLEDSVVPAEVLN